MKIIKKGVLILFIIFIFSFTYNVNISSKEKVKTDYIHEFEQDINNLIDGNEDTFFILPDFINYLEFKVESNKKIDAIKIVFDDVGNNYDYKIYSSADGYRYNDVDFRKDVLGKYTEKIRVDIEDVFIRIRVFSSNSSDFVNIREIEFLDKNGLKISNIDISKEEPLIEEVVFSKNNRGYKESIEGLISRTLGDEYIDFFEINILPDNVEKDYFRLFSIGEKIVIEGNNPNSLSIALNYYFEHYLKQTYNRFDDKKLNVPLPMPLVTEFIEKKIDVKYRYNYNYVAYGYTMAYWDFDDWQREIDWMALNGFNVALNLVGYEEVIRRFLSEFGFSFSDIVEYLTTPIYLPWMYMGNISKIGGEMTPEWFEERSKLSVKINNRMDELGIFPVHQVYIGQFPFSQKLEFDILQGGYWSKIKGSDRLSFINNDYEILSNVFYEKQREVMGETKYFSGDLFHEGGNFYNYDIQDVANRILSTLKKNEGNDSIWMMQSWGHSPSSEIIERLDKSNILILDLYSQVNTRWHGNSKFNGMSWNNKEFDNSNWIFGILNNFGGRSGLYGHFLHSISEFYDAKNRAEYLVGIGSTSEAIGYNDFIDELVTELIFEDKINVDEFVERYTINRYGGYNKKIVDGFYILLDTVYNPVVDIYHEGASESIINARPSFDVKSSSKWGRIHKNYNSDVLEKSLELYFSVYDEFKDNKFYINDLTEIASEVINNLIYDYYDDLKKAYKRDNNYELLNIRNKFLYLINLQANILYYNDRKSLTKIIDDIKKLNYDDYFKDTLIYNKKTILTTWYDKLVSEDDGLRDYGNTDFYELIGNLYYNRWKRFFDEIMYSNDLDKGKYDDYRFDLKWIYSDDSLKFDKSDKTLKELIELLMFDSSIKKSKFSFLTNIFYSISSLFK